MLVDDFIWLLVIVIKISLLAATRLHHVLMLLFLSDLVKHVFDRIDLRLDSVTFFRLDTDLNPGFLQRLTALPDCGFVLRSRLRVK